jgi:hypothetical protein
LDVEGNRIIVGTPFDDDSGVKAGAVYVFEKTGTTWVQTAKLVASDGTSDDWFGMTVSINSGQIVIGAPFASLIHFNEGAAYVFSNGATGWVEAARIRAKDAQAYALFGWVVAVEDSTAVVTNGGLTGTHVFDGSGATWTETSKVAVSSSGIALEGDVLALGRPTVTVNNNLNAGAVDVYLLQQPISTYCTAKQTPQGCFPFVTIAGCPSASMTSGFVVQAYNVNSGKPALLLYGVNGPAALPFQGGTLCIASPVRRTPIVVGSGSVYPCGGLLELDMEAFASGQLGGTPIPELKQAGTVVDCQWWGRDPGASFGSMLSDALEYTIGP